MMHLNIDGETSSGSKVGTMWRCKVLWLDAAEVFDSWRVFPRIVLMVYGWWAIHVTSWVMSWYEKLPGVERTGQVTAVIVAVVPGIFGMSGWVFKIYADGGRNWDAKP